MRGWLAGQVAGFPVVSAWADTEVSSALAQKRRIGAFPPAREAAARKLWRTAQSALLSVVSVELADFAAAADLCSQDDLNIRGPDAPHLAIARRLGLALATLDYGMEQAARRLGMPLITIS